MTWTVDASGTKTTTVTNTVTVSNGSPAALFAMTNTCAVGDTVVLSGTTAPGNFTFGTTYYVIASGLSGSQFELAATPGGAAIAYSSAGSAVVATIEHTLDAPLVNGTYVFVVDTINITFGDILELRCYDMIDGVNLRQLWKGAFQHTQINPAKHSPPVSISVGGKFTIIQTAGTGRSVPWVVRRI